MRGTLVRQLLLNANNDETRCSRNRRAVLLLPLLLLLSVAVSGCGTQVSFTPPSISAAHGTGLVGVTVSTLPAPLPLFHAYTGALPAPPAITANEAFLLNPDNGTIYLATNADQPVPMASTTKIMTAYVALTLGHLDQMIKVGPDADGATLAQEYGASVAGLRTGDMLSLRDLLYALLLPSGDDAAIAIADGIAGSQANFVALMNIEASLLGLRNTHYTDVHGLDMKDHNTSARDLAELATLAMRNKTFAQIVQTTAYIVPATATHGRYKWSTTNNLLITTNPYYYPGAIGIKTGFTGAAGGCLVFAARGPSGELLGVLLGEAVENNRFSDALALLNWGFGIQQQPQPSTTVPSATATAAPAA